jgi:hypothetical protein
VPKIYRATISAISLWAFTLVSPGAYAKRRYSLARSKCKPHRRVNFAISKPSCVRLGIRSSVSRLASKRE